MKTDVRLPVVALAALLCAALPATAQDLLGQYTAVIGQQDLLNSSGKALSEPGQILTQDRANFHRFGLRQSGDTSDDFFGSRENRARLESLLNAGRLDPKVAEALRSGSDVAVLVEIYGRAGQPEYLDVSLADDGQMDGQLADAGTAPDAAAMPPAPATTGQGPALSAADGSRWMALLVLGAAPDHLDRPLFLMGWLGQDRLQGRPEALAISQPAALARGVPQAGDPAVDGYVEALRQEAAAAAGAGPQRLELVFPAGMRFGSDGTGRVLGVNAVTNSGLDEGGSGPARTLQILAWKSSQIELRLKNALRLSEIPIGEDLAQAIDAQSRQGRSVVARLVVEVDPATLQVTSVSTGMPRAALTASAISFSLHTQAEDAPRMVPVPGDILASFDVPPLQDTARLDFDTATAGGISALYGLPVLGERIAAGMVQDILAPEFAGGVPGHLTTNRDDPYRTIEVAARLAALANAFPEVPLAPDAQDFVLFSLLSGPERDSTVPAALWKDGVVDGAIGGNEFDRARFYQDMEPVLRSALLARAPRLPLPMIWLWSAYFDEYDSAKGGFPLPSRSGSNLLAEEPDLLAATPDAAEAFVNRRADLTQGMPGLQRQAPMTLEYAVGPALVPPDIAGQITLADAARVVLPIVPERIVAYADPARTEEFVTIALSADVAPAAMQPEALLPEGLLQSTSPGQLAVAALRLVGGEATVREAVEAVVAASPQYDSLERPAIIAKQLAEIARLPADPVLWITAAVSLGDYDAAAGRLAIDPSRAPDFSVHGIDEIWLQEPYLAPAVPSQLQSLPADSQTAERIFDAVGSSGLYLALRITPATGLRDTYSVTLSFDIAEILVLREDLRGGQPSIVAVLTPTADQAIAAALVTDQPAASPPPDSPAPDQKAPDPLPVAPEPGAVNDVAADLALPEPAPVPTTAAALDVAGLTLGMASDAFAAESKALFDLPPVAVAGPDSPTEPMHTARGFLDPAGTQLVLGIHPPARPDGPVLAILRYTVYAAAEVSKDSLVAALAEKYGPPTQDWPDHGRYLWGAPSGPDPMAVCNPLNLPDPPPPLAVESDPRIEIGSALTQPGHWRQVIDWPKHSDTLLQNPAAAEICGPVVFAAILEEPAAGRLHLRVWLVDAASTAKALADPALAPPQTKPAKVKL